MDKQILQNFIFPGLDHEAPDVMYARCKNQAVTLSRSRKTIEFFQGGLVKFDTFFNGISIKKWKKYCGIEDLFASLLGEGEFVVRVGLHRVGHETKWLSEKIVQLSKGEYKDISIDSWKALDDGILFVSIKALQDGALMAGNWSTTTLCRNEVKLGVVITHFNRENYVIPAVERLNDELLSEDEFKNKIELVVADNSRSLRRADVEGDQVTLISNKNFGGAGGFNRGLIHLQDNNFTHCLFMDDDASCEVESIKRAYRLLSFFREESYAIAGSMLRDVKPSFLFEKGAMFDGICRPLKSGLDMKDVDDLLVAEIEDVRPDYGGWWFFAFSLSAVDKMAFPFFVRGDDLMFSMVNKLDIVTMNGVATWGDDFSLKSSPLTWYLDARNHLLQKITHMNSGFYSTAKVAAKYFFSNALSYNYSSARSVTKAVYDVAKGPGFWKDNLDTSILRKEIGDYQPSEKMVPIDRSLYGVKYNQPVESVLRKTARVITLNGYLVPTFFMKDDVVFQHKGFRASFREIFLHKKVLYEYEPYGLGYVAEHRKGLFLKESFSFFKALFLFFINFKKIKKSYEGVIDHMTSRAFWDDVFKTK